jgi:hypothetical protein
VKYVYFCPNNPREWHGAEVVVVSESGGLVIQTIRASGMEQKYLDGGATVP